MEAARGPLFPRPAQGNPDRMDWLKILHILCVMGWMTSIFAVPRAIIYWKRDFIASGRQGPLGDLTYRLYRFSAGLAVIAVLSGLWLGWAVWSFAPWVHVKLTLVAALAGHYVFRESDLYLRIFNEVSVLGAIAILWVVVAKPF